MTPVDKGGYFVFPPDESYRSINLIKDENVITVNNYFECLNYVKAVSATASRRILLMLKKITLYIQFYFLVDCLATVSLINNL